MSSDVHEGLIDHAIIDKALRALLEAFDHAEARDVGALFRSFADHVRSHLAREDLDIAKYADVDAEDAKKLAAEHASFRSSLDELSAASREGRLGKAEIHTMKLSLILHEAHEETGLYRWVASR